MKAKSTSSKPQKAGFTWVADRRAKNAGYWRKLKAGAKAGGLASKLIAGAVVAGAAAGAAQAMRKKPGGAPKVPEPPSNLSEAPSVESEASKLQRIKKRNTAIVVGTIAAANAAPSMDVRYWVTNL